MHQDKKVSLVTGAGEGIGAAIAIELAQTGLHVIITDKNLTSLTNTENTIISNGGTCTVVELNMKDFLGIDRLGFEIFKRWRKLDILVANAAILGTLSPLHHQSNEEFSDVLNINLISNHRLIRSVDSLLKQGMSSKAIFLTSSVSFNPKPFWGAYSISKAALNHMTKLWAQENTHNNLSICTIEPGETNTRLRKHANPGENIENLQDPVTVAKSIVKFICANKVYKGETIKLKDI
jgi:NAD(P)-dependent dehydrogenase (short-subunit alcohol dehydrogenase family)